MAKPFADEEEGLLHCRAKIALFSEETGGYLQSKSTYSPDLHLQKLRENAPPANFERCVFRIKVVNSNQIMQDGYESFVVTYGDRVQLQHTYSNRYLSVSRRLHSQVERNSFQAKLLKLEDVPDEQDTLFIIRPRYKLRREGEKVHFNDQAVLVTDSAHSRYLHVAGRRGADDVYEVNCSSSPTSWTVHLYDDVKEDSQVIRLGEPILLFHKELEALLASTPLHHDPAQDNGCVCSRACRIRKGLP